MLQYAVLSCLSRSPTCTTISCPARTRVGCFSTDIEHPSPGTTVTGHAADAWHTSSPVDVLAWNAATHTTDVLFTVNLPPAPSNFAPGQSAPFGVFSSNCVVSTDFSFCMSTTSSGSSRTIFSVICVPCHVPVSRLSSGFPNGPVISSLACSTAAEPRTAIPCSGRALRQGRIAPPTSESSPRGRSACSADTPSVPPRWAGDLLAVLPRLVALHRHHKVQLRQDLRVHVVQRRLHDQFPELRQRLGDPHNRRPRHRSAIRAPHRAVAPTVAPTHLHVRPRARLGPHEGPDGPRVGIPDALAVHLVRAEAIGLRRLHRRPSVEVQVHPRVLPHHLPRRPREHRPRGRDRLVEQALRRGALARRLVLLPARIGERRQRPLLPRQLEAPVLPAEPVVRLPRPLQQVVLPDQVGRVARDLGERAPEGARTPEHVQLLVLVVHGHGRPDQPLVFVLQLPLPRPVVRREVHRPNLPRHLRHRPVALPQRPLDHVPRRPHHHRRGPVPPRGARLPGLHQFPRERPVEVGRLDRLRQVQAEQHHAPRRPVHHVAVQVKPVRPAIPSVPAEHVQ
eukprot:Sspe_Gene.23422::Locus_9101_Transcript_1_1_Confidence_1.000_Length_4302::g.23422::m.23422